MKNIFFVKPDQFETALAMEQKLLSLPEESGILFASVTVLPNPNAPETQPPLFRVVIGCSRKVEVDLMHATAKRFLREFVQNERELLVEAYRGTARNSTSTAKATNPS